MLDVRRTLFVVFLVLIIGCTRSSQTSTPFIQFEIAPHDLVLSSGEKLTLRAFATTNSSEPITYVWEKLEGTNAIHVSNKDTLTLGSESENQCRAAAETYRVIANAGALRVEKPFSIKAECTRAPLTGKASDALSISPQQALLAPGEKINLIATTRLKGAALKWERVENGQKTLLAQNGDYVFEAPALEFPCQTKDFSLIATVVHGDAEDTKTIIIRVQNKACTLDANSGLTSNDTTRLLIANDDSVFIGSKNGLTRFKDGKTTTFFTAANNVPLEIVTALAQIDTTVYIAKAKRTAQSGVTGLGIDALHLRGDSYFWDSKTLSPNEYKGRICFDCPKDEAIYASLDHKNKTYLGGDGGIFVFKDGKQLARFDGSQWGGKSGIFGIASNRSVRALAADASGSLWIGLQASLFEKGGLLRLQPSQDGLTGAWSGPERLPQSQDVRALAVDAGDNLWVATDNGLVQRSRAGAFKTFDSKNGLPSTNIRDVVYHAETGNLWIATSAGVVRWSLAMIK